MAVIIERLRYDGDRPGVGKIVRWNSRSSDRYSRSERNRMWCARRMGRE